jgi:hypothetical protein
MGNLARVATVFLAGTLLSSGCSTKPVTTTAVGIRSDGGIGGPRDGGMMTNTTPPGGIDPVACPSTPPMPRRAAGDSCSCDIECATGTCQGGVCCAGMACAALKPLGVACESNSQCQSNFCADGVCCNVACTGACVSCNQPEMMGECAPVPAGSEDLHGICRKDSPATCGQSGFCNGQGGCAKFSAGTVCALSACEGRDKFVPSSLCDGEGTCVKGVALSCAPSTCEAGACLNSCTGNDKCMAPNSCVNGSCGPKGLGQDCTANTQCASMNCVDGVCCENACTGKCRFCASPEARGKCLPVKANVVDQRAARGEKDPAKICVVQEPSTCGTDGRCDGKGGCQKYKDMTVCGQPRCDATANTQTAAAVCMGGACRIPAARTCAPFRGCSGNACRGSCASDAQCAPGNVCTASSCGKKPNGAICTANSECTSNTCAQGRCCAGPCTATCKSCAVAGQEGACVNVPTGGADPAGMCRDDACSNGCDGLGGCRREPVNSTCGTPSCASNSQQTTRTCSASGVCETKNVACGSGFTCMGGSCVANPKRNGELCVADAECESKNCERSSGGNNVCCASKCDGDCKECQAGTGTCGNRGGGCEGGGSCMGGICCQSGLTNCGGVCHNLQTDEQNCGTCGKVCQNQREICMGGSCACADSAMIKCNNVCIDPKTDVENCGGCGNRCPVGATCTNGMCSGCPNGGHNCDGVCKACCVECNECQRCSDDGRRCDSARDSQSCGSGPRVCCVGMCCMPNKVCGSNGCSDPIPTCDSQQCAAMGPCRECKSDGTCGMKTSGGCDDGDACTSSDQCNSGGACVGTAKICNAPGACEKAEGASCSNGNCVYPANTGADCNDGDACTSGEKCNANKQCAGGAPKVCNAPGACEKADGATCSDGTCNYLADTGASCDDGDACTSGEKCNANKQCTGGAQKTCNTPGMCEKAEGAGCNGGNCSYPPDTGAACNDGDACTTGETCNASKQCAGGAQKTCNTPGMCEKTEGATCSNGDCSYPADTGASCNDGDACTTGEQCNGNKQCAGGMQKVCNTPGICEKAEGARCMGGDCQYPRADNGSACMISNAAGTCTDGVCVPTAP